MSRFVNHLFGTIASQANSLLNSSIGFVPVNNTGGTINIKANPEWMGLRSREQQKLAYELCFPLASVVDRLAQYDLNGKIEILKLKGKGKDDYAKGAWADNMNKLFAQPNPLQSWEQFRGQQNVYKRIFGFCPILPIVPVGLNYAVSMVNLPPWLFGVKGTKDILYATKPSDLIREYTVNLLGKSLTFTPDKLFLIKDGFFQDESTDYLLPQSRLVGLDMAISNVCAAMEADNVLLKKRGPLGFISHDAAATKDSVAGYLPMTQKEKDELQQSLSNYGLSLTQYQYVISRQAAKWNPMSYDVNQLGTKETVIAGEKAICHRYGFPYVMYEETEAVYANGLNAAKSVYQNEVIPASNKDMKEYNYFFKAEENNAVITTDFTHLPVLQEDELMRATAAKAWNEALKMEYDNGLITINQWLTARGYDTIPGGDVYAGDKTEDSPNDNQEPDNQEDQPIIE